MTITTVIIIGFVFVGVACFIAGYQAGQSAMQKELKPLYAEVCSMRELVEQCIGRKP
jgi:hypothetical protein